MQERSKCLHTIIIPLWDSDFSAFEQHMTRDPPECSSRRGQYYYYYYMDVFKWRANNRRKNARCG